MSSPPKCVLYSAGTRTYTRTHTELWYLYLYKDPHKGTAPCHSCPSAPAFFLSSFLLYGVNNLQLVIKGSAQLNTTTLHLCTADKQLETAMFCWFYLQHRQHWAAAAAASAAWGRLLTGPRGTSMGRCIELFKSICLVFQERQEKY